MIRLFDKDSKIIKYISDGALLTVHQNRRLTDEGYISEQLTVQMNILDDDIFNGAEYMTIPAKGHDTLHHLFWIKDKYSDNRFTHFTGVLEGIEELSKTPIIDVRPQNTTIRQAAEQALADTNYIVRFAADAGRRSSNAYFTDVWSALKRYAAVWRVEMQLFVEVTETGIGARYIDFRKKIGVNNGARVVYGHNALEILKEEDRTEIYTALIGRGRGEEVGTSEEGDATFGRKINFKDIEWKKSNGDPLNKPLGQYYLELPEATQLYGIKYGNTMKPKIGYVDVDTEDAEEVLALTHEALLQVSRPKVMFRAAAVYLKGEIGDTVRVVRKDRGIDYDTRIFDITHDRLENSILDIKLGDNMLETQAARERRIAGSAAVQVEEQINNNLTEHVQYIVSANGLNRNYYTTIDPREEGFNPMLNDIWYQPDPDSEGDTILYIWNGSVWEEVTRTFNNTKVADLIKDVQELKDAVAEDVEITIDNIIDILDGASEVNLSHIFARLIGDERFSTLFYQEAENIGFVYREGEEVKSIIAIQNGVPFIRGEHIILDGNTIVDGDFTVTEEMIADEAIIEKLEVTGIDAAKIRVINLDFDSMAGGDIELSRGIRITNNGAVVMEVTSEGKFRFDATAAGLGNIGIADKDNASGTNIYTDNADNSVVHVEIDGLSVRGGEPTPDAPVEIVSLNDFDVVSSVGKKNLIPNSVRPTQSGGAVIERNVQTPFGIFDVNLYTNEFPLIRYEYPSNQIKSYGKYTFSVFMKTKNKGDTTQVVMDISDNPASTKTVTDEWQRFNVSADSILSRNRLHADLRRDSGTTPMYIAFWQLEHENLTPYAPAPEDIAEDDNRPLIDKISLHLDEPLRSVRDVNDRLFRDIDGLWKIERKVSETVLTDEDSWGEQSGHYWIRFGGSEFNMKVNSFNIIMSSYEHKQIASSDENSFYFGAGNSGITHNGNVIFRNPDISGLNEWKDWLKDNHIQVLYEIEPFIEILSDEFQNKLNNLRSFQYSNYVYTVSDLQPTLHATFKGGGWYDRFKLENIELTPGPEGPQGPPGYSPIKGVDYFDGVDGQDGTDGDNSYLWVMYSQNANGSGMVDNPTNAKYIGVATTTTPTKPSATSAYKWSLIKGEDGVPGEEGSDGKTSYLHIKYSNNGGQTFTANNGEAVGDWIGTYVDFTEADSNNVSDYTWNKVKGEKGETGDEGPRGFEGPEGQSQYVHIRYSAIADGSGHVPNPTLNTKYIGIAVTNTDTTPQSVSAYTWSKYQGEDGSEGPPGIPGKDGDDGQTTYTWVKYADTPTSGMEDYPDGKTYIGLAFNKTTATESTNYNDYQWSLLPQHIDLGTRNLIPKSDAVEHMSEWHGLGTSRTTVSSQYSLRDYLCVFRDDVVYKTEVGVYSPPLTQNLIEGRTYTFRYKATYFRYTNPDMTYIYFVNDTPNTTNQYISLGEVNRRKFTSNEFSDEWIYEITAVSNFSGPARILIGTQATQTASRALIFIKELMLVEGNKAPEDWTLAPEDLVYDFNTGLGTVTGHVNDIRTDVNSFFSELESKQDVDEYQQKIEEIEEALSAEARTMSGISGNVTSLLARTSAAEWELGEQSQTVKFVNTYMTEAEEGLFIHTEGGKNGVLIDTERISFISEGDDEIFYISGQNLYIKSGIIVNSFKVGTHRQVRLNSSSTITEWVSE